MCQLSFIFIILIKKLVVVVVSNVKTYTLVAIAATIEPMSGKNRHLVADEQVEFEK